MLSALCNHNRARCRNCHYSRNRNDHISGVGAAVVCARIVRVGIGNDLGDYSGLAVLVGFDLLYDLSAGRLLTAAVIARTNRCRSVSLIEKVVINGCNYEVIELNDRSIYTCSGNER